MRCWPGSSVQEKKKTRWRYLSCYCSHTVTEEEEEEEEKRGLNRRTEHLSSEFRKENTFKWTELKMLRPKRRSQWKWNIKTHLKILPDLQAFTNTVHHTVDMVCVVDSHVCSSDRPVIKNVLGSRYSDNSDCRRFRRNDWFNLDNYHFEYLKTTKLIPNHFTHFFHHNHNNKEWVFTIF